MLTTMIAATIPKTLSPFVQFPSITKFSTEWPDIGASDRATSRSSVIKSPIATWNTLLVFCSGSSASHFSNDESISGVVSSSLSCPFFFASRISCAYFS